MPSSDAIPTHSRFARRLALGGLAGLAAARVAAAQADSARAAERAAAPALITAARTTTPIRLDGRLDEPVWGATDSITDFRQREPTEGAAASERTVVKVVRDGAALYVGVRAEDREMARLRATQLRRDADLGVDDNVTLLIDSFHDRRGAFVFRTNANGAMWDAQQTGPEALNRDWNGIWDVAVARDGGGWTAEFRIPFRTLRFRPGAATIGFNVRRLLRARNEEVLWRSYARRQGLSNLLFAGEVAGFGDVARGRGVELRPYALARAIAPAHDVGGARLEAGTAEAKAGLDAKAAVSPTLTADLTVNTDFAQVEADQQVINLSRFPTFFPEKREFFLESSGLFDFGAGERTQLFYSRRIGVRRGDAVPIRAGARLYGKVGPWSLGVLDARTGGPDDANDAVVRVRRDLLDRATVGAIATARSGPGVRGVERAAGVDVSLPLLVRDRNVEPSLWVAGTRNPGDARTPMAWRASVDYPNDLVESFVSLFRIDRGFDPRLGFVRRSGIWETTGELSVLPRPHVLGIRQLELTPLPHWDVIADDTGSLLRARDWQTASFEWRVLGGELQSGDEFELNVQRRLDAPAERFDIFDGVDIRPGRYWWTRYEAQYSTSGARALGFDGGVSWGQFYDGHDNAVELGATWRGGGHLILGADVQRDAVRLPAGRFTATEASGRAEYAFTRRAGLLSFVQWNNEDRRIDFNVRFHWIPTIGDDVFVVWNSGYTTDRASPLRFPARRALGRPLNGAVVLKVIHRLAP